MKQLHDKWYKNTAKYHSPTIHLQQVSCILTPNGKAFLPL